MPYPSGTFPRRIALTSPGAWRLHRSRQLGEMSVVEIQPLHRVSAGGTYTRGLCLLVPKNETRVGFGARLGLEF